MITYRSTRGLETGVALEDVILRGLACDGGLYLPETLPGLTGQTGRTYADSARAVFAPFLAPFLGSEEALDRLITDAYRDFRAKDVVHLWDYDDRITVMDLFEGPTFAFKDIALQVLGLLLGHLASKRGEAVTLIGATSGDTGAAAIEAVRGKPGVRLVMLHPRGRVTDVQRKQMTTVTDSNIINIAVDGSFDDCQALVKDALAKPDWAGQSILSSVNSINWIRILGQVTYYAYASSLLGGESQRVRFAVPSGNFGDAYAGYLARKMGFPVGGILVATNANDILARTLDTGVYDRREALETLAPAMDIQVASNFERLLFDACGRDGARVAEMMGALKREGKFALAESELDYIRRYFKATSISDAELLAEMKSCHQTTGQRLCPHSAIGVLGAKRTFAEAKGPIVALATAHWGKFHHAAQQAFGDLDGLPGPLGALASLSEHALNAAAEPEALEMLVKARLAASEEG